MALSTAALAQEQAVDSTTVQTIGAAGQSKGAERTVLASPATSVSGSQNGDIVVTATRRAERLQDVPLAVSVLTGEKLAKTGFKTFNDIQYQATGITITPATSTTDNGIRLRGVGTAASFASASEQNVGLVVDNVVVPFGNPVNSLGDIDRVEILKGPQGTQFGKNASSGVVSITTARPSTKAVSGRVFGSYGSLDERDVNASINLPLSSDLALQVFGYDRANDDFIYNSVQKRGWGGNHTYGGRGKLLWEPSDTLSFLLIGDYSHTKINGTNPWTLRTLTDPTSFASASALAGITIGPDNTTSIENRAGNTINENYGASLEIDKALGDYEVTSITAWRGYQVQGSDYSIDASDFDTFSAQNSSNRNRFFSQELRLTSPRGHAFEYVAGVYASRLDVGLGSASSAQYRPLYAINPGLIVSISNGIGSVKTRSDSVAGFVDGSLRISESFRLLGGGRVNYDNVKASSFSVIDPAYPGGPTATGFVVPYTPNALARSAIDNVGWSGRFGFEYKPQRDIMLYATVARGYLGPTTTFSILSNTQARVKPQIVKDATIGAKMQFLDRKLTVNVNGFYDSYKNLQVTTFRDAEFLTGNAGGLKSRGFEIETNMRPIPQFGVSMGYTYVKATYTSYFTDCPLSIQLTSASGANDPRCQAGPNGTQYQAAGDDLVGAPRHTLTAGSDFRVDVTPGLRLDGSVNYYLRGKTYASAGDDFLRLPEQSIVNLNFGIGTADSAWRVGVFARNLFDDRFKASLLGIPFAPTGTVANVLTREGRRTLGVSGEVRF